MAQRLPGAAGIYKEVRHVLCTPAISRASGSGSTGKSRDLSVDEFVLFDGLLPFLSEGLLARQVEERRRREKSVLGGRVLVCPRKYVSG